MAKTFVDAQLVSEIADCKRKMIELNKLADEYHSDIKNLGTNESARFLSRFLDIIERRYK
jgi:hypothetical protein